MEERILNEWKIVGKASESGFSMVYKVVRDDGFVCAIKRLTLPKSVEEADKLMKAGKISSYEETNSYFMGLMQFELEILNKFNGNPNIIHFYDFSQEYTKDGYGVNYYIRMEYANDIKGYFSKNGVSPDDVVKMAIDICSALELCSANDICHNDIKPGNIFIGNDGKYKLGDFGIASQIGSDNLVTFGTLNYLSPEVYNKVPTTASSDLYSLGLVMYKLLAGELPFVGGTVTETAAIGIRMGGEPVPVIEGVDLALMNIVSKACSVNSADRFSSAEEMKLALTKLTEISTKKKNISFISSLVEDTISVYDNALLTGQGIDTTGTKMVNRFKKISKSTLIKRGVMALALLLICLGFFGYRMLNRKCDAGYINKGFSCVKGYYSCSTGYTLNSKNKCQKTIKSVAAKVTYTCKPGFTYTNEMCVSDVVKEPVFVYQCADGFTLNGTKCEKIETNDAVVTYSCPSGYTRVDEACVKGNTVNANVSYSCPNGYTLGKNSSGVSICSKSVASSSTVNATVSYSCSDGSTPNSQNKCARSYQTYSSYMCNGEYSGGMYGWYGTCTVYDVAANKTYTCPANTRNNNNGTCTYTGNTTDVKSATESYSCPAGFTRIGAQCTNAETINGNPVYTCLDSQRREGKKCITTISTDAVGMYSCPDGFIASGVTCIQNEFPQPIKKYSCSKVYTLNGGMCEQYETKVAKANYQ